MKPTNSTKPQKPMKTLIALVIALVLMFAIAACTAGAGDTVSSAGAAYAAGHTVERSAPEAGVNVNFEYSTEAGIGTAGGQSL